MTIKKSVIFILTISVLLSGCISDDSSEDDKYITMENGIKVYGDFEKIEINDVEIETHGYDIEKGDFDCCEGIHPEKFPTEGDNAYYTAEFAITFDVGSLVDEDLKVEVITSFYNSEGVILGNVTKEILYCCSFIHHGSVGDMIYYHFNDNGFYDVEYFSFRIITEQK